MISYESDSWYFVYDEPTALWTWKKLSPAGEELGQSAFSFASFTVCVSDAERAGFDADVSAVRRVRSSELVVRPRMPPIERRRKVRV